jgi:hypothetical protein
MRVGEGFAAYFGVGREAIVESIVRQSITINSGIGVIFMHFQEERIMGQSTGSLTPAFAPLPLACYPLCDTQFGGTPNL